VLLIKDTTKAANRKQCAGTADRPELCCVALQVLRASGMTFSATKCLVVLQGVQVAFLLLHDWIPLGRLTNLKAVQESDPRGKLILTTLLSALPFAAVFGASCAYWNAARWPMWLQMWLWYTYGAALAGMLWAWWIPYLLLPNPERARRHQVRFAGTPRFLPEHNGIAPDTLHVLYHSTIVATVVLLAKL
jgi:hypothetical protein